MSETRIELRRLRWIGLAYLIAPVVGILVVWAPLAVQEILARTSGRTILNGSLLFVIFGIPVCAVGELAFATPFIVAFDRYRWRWLNGWTVSGIGYLSAALVSLIGELRPLSPAEQSSGSNVILILNGHHTLSGWMNILIGSLEMGFVGLAMALTFRLIAIQKLIAKPL